jgi:hypothetical protein
MRTGSAHATGYLALLGFWLAMSPGQVANAQELRNPRIQRSLQMVEVARGHIEMAEHRSPPELREEVRRIGHELDDAHHELADTLESMGTRRQIEPGRAEPTDRPIRAAAEAMRRALDELTRGVSDQDLRGRLREAADHERAALEHVDRLAHREEAMMAPPPPPPVVELRHPRLQHAAQMLELARAQLEVAAHQDSPELHDAARDSIHDIDDAIHELAEAFTSVDSARTIGAVPVESTNRPIAAARDALRRAIDELSGAGREEYHGHARLAADRTHAALDRLEDMTRREEAMLAHPVVVEMRHPHLQRSLQMLEVAHAMMDQAQRRSPRDMRDREYRIAHEVEDAMREVSESLAAVGVTRTIEPARVEATEHPLRAAREALSHAADELTGVTTDEFHGHARRAAERARIARDEIEDLVRWEERR